ncbi:MAG: aminopeptidase P N-terminal domain-containing protein [Acidobacteria bacterium]|nr:aminopeptidase P N-terminal domain-containing protein [Acidobacteriota bacterium]
MFRTILIGFFLLQAAAAFADDNAFFAARREALMKKMEGAVAILQGAPDTRSYATFRQDNNFYYLTGVEVPNALLLLDASRRHSILFLPGLNEEAERWDGPRLVPGPEAQRRTGVDEVLELSRFETELEKRKNDLRILYIPFSPLETAATSRDRALQHDSAQQNDPWDGRPSRESAFEKNLQAKLGSSLIIRNLSPFLDEMRRVKDAQEIERLRVAGRIAALGLKEAIRSAVPGMFEYQLAALAEFIFSWHGASGPAFYPIVGSGPNSCIFHYSQNRRKMMEGEIVVMDIGADFRYYQSDITRTFPISGKFSEEQARFYRIVLEAQKAALEKVRPGASFHVLSKAVDDVLERYGYARYMTHGVGHYVGMSNHDVGYLEVFEPGAVIAVEPGVYLPEKNLGIRIEDTVLVTKDGYEILSNAVPKEVIDIENLMSEKGITEAIRQ